MELFALVALAGLAFWVWMIIDCVTNEPSVGNDKLSWIIVIVFAQVIGAFIYYFVRHCKRLEEA
jgi:prolipoprotein diacylglyceryltransferase